MHEFQECGSNYLQMSWVLLTIKVGSVMKCKHQQWSDAKRVHPSNGIFNGRRLTTMLDPRSEWRWEGVLLIPIDEVLDHLIMSMT